MKVDVYLKLNPELSRKFAEENTANLTDEQITDLVDRLRPSLVKAFATIEQKYLEGARAQYAKSGAKELFAADGGRMCAMIDQIRESLEDPETESVNTPDADESAALAKLLSTGTIVCYPSFRLSDLVTGREIVVAVRDILLAGGAIRDDDIDKLRAITADDIFCLREATDETAMKEAVFMSLEYCCLAAAKRMKALSAREEALTWLDLHELLKTRAKRYDQSLRPETAAKFVEDFKAAVVAFARILRYENL